MLVFTMDLWFYYVFEARFRPGLVRRALRPSLGERQNANMYNSCSTLLRRGIDQVWSALRSGRASRRAPEENWERSATLWQRGVRRVLHRFPSFYRNETKS